MDMLWEGNDGELEVWEGGGLDCCVVLNLDVITGDPVLPRQEPNQLSSLR